MYLFATPFILQITDVTKSDVFVTETTTEQNGI